MISRGEQIVKRARKNWGRIEFGGQTIERLIYEQEKDEKRNLETAFIEYQNDYVAVWRPLSNPPAKWRPIYSVRMVRSDSSRVVRPRRESRVVEGNEVRLPVADLKIDPQFKRHLAILNGDKK